MITETSIPIRIVFEAKVVEVGKKTFRFERVFERNVFEKVMFDNFGKIVCEEADFSKVFREGDMIYVSVSFLESEPKDGFVSSCEGRFSMRGVVNDKFGYGMSIRKSSVEKLKFIQRFFINLEFGMVVESSLLDEGVNPFELGDSVLVEAALFSNPLSPTLCSAMLSQPPLLKQ